jgi:MarR family transcriptional regulator, organic hydroperoxide resistance regulator
MTSSMPAKTPRLDAWQLLQRLMMDYQRPRFLGLCSEFDITPPQLFTLRRLEPEQQISMSELARWLACDASNVTGIVDRLETRGLLERRSSPGDRRVKMLALTDDGVALRDELRRRMDEPPPQLAALSASDQRALRDILRRALDG